MIKGLACLPPVLLLVATLCSSPLGAQTSEILDLTKVGTDPRWKIAGRTASAVDIDGSKALHVDEGPGMGLVWLSGYDFANGVIEADIRGRSQPVQGSFVGVAFRIVDERTHDAVYFRPFNFRADDSTRRNHAVQYVSHPEWTWQRLREERPGRFEKAIVPAPDGDRWFHVRVVVDRPTVRVFVNDDAAPSLVVNELSGRTHGAVGIWVGEGSGGYFANLRVARSGTGAGPTR